MTAEQFEERTGIHPYSVTACKGCRDAVCAGNTWRLGREIRQSPFGHDLVRAQALVDATAHIDPAMREAKGKPYPMARPRDMRDVDRDAALVPEPVAREQIEAMKAYQQRRQEWARLAREERADLMKLIRENRALRDPPKSCETCGKERVTELMAYRGEEFDPWAGAWVGKKCARDVERRDVARWANRASVYEHDPDPMQDQMIRELMKHFREEQIRRVTKREYREEQARRVERRGRGIVD